MKRPRPWLATDLDNTLIHSHRRRQEGDFCVEWLEGKEQSYMTETSIRLLRQLRQKIRLLAVTTRSGEQYLRIRWPQGCRPEYAVTTNGARLFHGEREEPRWREVLREACLPYRQELERLRRKYEGSPLYRCRLVEDAYLFLCAEDGGSMEASLGEFRRETALPVAATGRKLYVFPPPLDKGAALARLRRDLTLPFVYGAGDSPIDLPLLLASDISFVPHDYPADHPRLRRQPEDSGNFAEWFLGNIAGDVFCGAPPSF